MSSPPITIKPLERPFDVTFPDPSVPGGGIPPIPGSKSLTNRALLLAALADGKSTLTGVLFSDDTRVMMKALKDLGFTLDIDEASHTVTVHGQAGKIPAKQADLFLGNAGTAMRFLTAACCLGEPGSEYTLRGIDRMHERPIGELVEPLRELGAKIEYLGNEGYPPLRIAACGLAGGELTLKPTLSSQFISALVQVAPYMQRTLQINFDGPVTSWPYVKMTTELMYPFGVRENYEILYSIDTSHANTISGIGIKLKPLSAYDMCIEPDASNASYFFAISAATPDASFSIKGLHGGSLQGDVRFVEALKDMGALSDIGDHGIRVSGVRQLRGIDADFNHIPDAAMTIATLAILADGPTTIRNVGNWRVKETDRMAAMQAELTKLGATVEVNGDDITITPPPGGKITPASIDTYDDHRMAMAFSVIGLAQPGVTINDPDCVNKTFPDFFKYLEYLRPRK
jgi:3-phosphoshikimate 1-carboxyvinyltransferase